MKPGEYEDLPKREKIGPLHAVAKMNGGGTRYAEEDSRTHRTRSKFKRAKTKDQRPRYGA